ncbi:MAG: hypothetical protein ACHP79_16195, partial [Terriglobales bacterium]
MPKPLDAATKKQLADRVNYYREMGIYDFYRRPVERAAEGGQAAAESAMAADVATPAEVAKTGRTSATMLPVITDKPAAL